MKPSPQLLLAQTGAQLATAHGVACSVDAHAWPRVTLHFEDSAHDLVFVPSRPGQAAFHHLPGFDVSYQRRPDEQDGVPETQQRLLSAFLELFAPLSLDLPQGLVHDVDGVERLDIIGICNLRCTYCGEMKSPALPMPEVQRQLDALQARHGGDLSRVVLVLSGGEPTLSPLLPETVRRASALGFADILLTTNGLRLADPDYADELAAAGLRHVEVSLRSFEPEAYARLTRTKGNHAKALAGLENAIARFDVLANIVINRWNYLELPEVARRLSALAAQSGHHVVLMPAIVVVEIIPDRMQSELAERLIEASIPCSMMMPSLAEAIRWDHAQPRRIFIEHFDGLCYAPPCAGRAYPEVLEHAPVRHNTMTCAYVEPGQELPGSGRVKPSSCRTCRLDAVCPGIAPGNAALHGFGDVVPL